MITRRVAIAACTLLVGCSTVELALNGGKPALKPGEPVPPNMAVVLVGIMGQPGGSKPDYFQFVHGSWPALEFKFPGQSGGIVAVPIPVGIKKLRLRSVTVEGQAGHYAGTRSVGYRSVETQSLDIDSPGIYYLATLTVWREIKSSAEPIPQQLSQWQAEMGSSMAGLEPVNFKWPAR